MRALLVVFGALLLPAIAFAQAVVPGQIVAVTPPPSVDLTGIAVAAVGGFFSVLGLVVSIYIQQRVKNQDAAATLEKAVANSLGAIQQAATTGIQMAAPKVNLPVGTDPRVVVGTQYVLDHAGTEANTLGVSTELIAGKVAAKIGLANIAATTAANTAANTGNGPVPGVSIIQPPPAPLAPIAVMMPMAKPAPAPLAPVVAAAPPPPPAPVANPGTSA
jgi:hypothetical protein